MSEFINTIEVLGDEATMDAIIERTITEFKDDTLTEIGRCAFNSCADLTTVDLPNVEILRSYAFTGCTSLTALNIPKVTVIPQPAFDGCTSLAEICLPGVITVSGDGFQKCTGLKRVILPNAKTIAIAAFQFCDNVEYIDLGAIETIKAQNFGSKITCMIVRTTKVCALDSGINLSSAHIYVPRALIEEYKAATNWSTYADQFRALEDYTVDGTTTGELDESKI